MKLKPAVRQKIIRDASISLFIYALPVILMFIYFSISGQKPWLNPQKKAEPTSIHR